MPSVLVKLALSQVDFYELLINHAKIPSKRMIILAVNVTFYTRTRCPLCEKAKADLLELREELAFDLKEIDIETSDDLTERFGLMIPVVYINESEAGYGIIDKDYLRTLICEKK